MYYEKEFIVQDIISRVMAAYDDIGSTVPNYYANIVLPELTLKEYKFLQEVANGNFR